MFDARNAHFLSSNTSLSFNGLSAMIDSTLNNKKIQKSKFQFGNHKANKEVKGMIRFYENLVFHQYY